MAHGNNTLSMEIQLLILGGDNVIKTAGFLKMGEKTENPVSLCCSWVNIII